MELKTAEDTSGSFGSCENAKLKSEIESHSRVLNDSDTVGENGIQGELPVVPSTQLPQLSIHAVPLGVLLQSTGKLVVVNICTLVHDEDGEFPLAHIDFNCHS